MLAMGGCDRTQDKTYACKGDVYLLPENVAESPPDFEIGVRVNRAEIQINESLPFFATKIPSCSDKGPQRWNGNDDSPYFSTRCGHQNDRVEFSRATFNYLTAHLSLYHFGAVAEGGEFKCSPAKTT
jgi:hypothetical protein